MNIELFIHNVGYIVIIIANLLVGLFVLIKNPRKLSNIMLFLASLCFALYAGAYCLGVNAVDHSLSRYYMLFTMINILTVCFSAHWSLAVTNKVKEHKKGVIVMYVVAAVLYIFFLTDTSRFLAPSVSRLYFPNYYNAGPYYWVFILYFAVVYFYFMFCLVKTYRNTDPIEKNRLRYFIASFIFGYIFGSIGFLPTFNITFFDPIFTILAGFYTVPLAYGIIKYDLMDIHIMAKRALIYAIAVSLVSIFITFISFSNNFVAAVNPNFPIWPIPVGASLLSVLIGVFVWEKIRETDSLKYEFINNVTHKFRTPLTHIKWLSEELRTENNQETRDRDVEQIEYASMRLFEMTNILIDVARDDNNDYLYRFVKGDLGQVVKDIVNNHLDQAKEKKIEVKLDMALNIPSVTIDVRRLSFAIQILFENAIIYTPKGGKVIISLARDDNQILFSIKDSGIGIPKEELPHLFSKFYRAQNARRTDTEGMGIGLFMSKTIIEKHGGEIKAESSGQGQGSKFTFTLPISS